MEHGKVKESGNKTIRQYEGMLTKNTDSTCLGMNPRCDDADKLPGRLLVDQLVLVTKGINIGCYLIPEKM